MNGREDRAQHAVAGVRDHHDREPVAASGVRETKAAKGIECETNARDPKGANNFDGHADPLVNGRKNQSEANRGDDRADAVEEKDGAVVQHAAEPVASPLRCVKSERR